MSDPETALTLTSLGTDGCAVVFGATGGIGGALADNAADSPAFARVFRLSRRPDTHLPDTLAFDLEDEASIEAAAATIRAAALPVRLVIVATGILHGPDGLAPEKTWRSLSAPTMETVFRLNTIGPALVAKHFLPLLDRSHKSVFAAISARVGSIEDNRLGGWYAYRASKAALNMMIRTLSIELQRRNPQALCVGLHPGTVDTALSEPFQGNVPEGGLFTPARSARALLSVLDGLDTGDTGQVFAWDGQRIPF